MIEKVIEFEDYNGVTRVEPFCFHLGKAELAEMAMANTGLDVYLKKIIEEEDTAKIIETFKDLIGRSVGRRSEDGRRFVKSKEITDDFMQSPAYEVLFMELIMNAGYASQFIQGLVPADLIAEATASQSTPKDDYTLEELVAMGSAEFENVAGPDPKNMSRDHLIAAMARKQAEPPQLHLDSIGT